MTTWDMLFPILEPGEVHLWLLTPPQVEGFATAGEALLSGIQRRRAEGLADPQERRRYMGRQGALRRLLSLYCRVPEAWLRFSQSAGKPRVEAPADAPHFSVSASEGWVLAAFCRDQGLGVDLELERGDFDYRGVLRRHFSAAETAAFERLEAPERLGAFLRAWTRKEALLKLAGLGLDALDSLRASGRPGSGWVEELPLPGRLRGSLALLRPPSALRSMSLEAGRSPEGMEVPA